MVLHCNSWAQDLGGFTGDWGSVVINELMVDPVPAVGQPEDEYVELFCRSPGQVRMKGWKLQVNSRFHSIPDTVLPSGSFLLAGGISLPNEEAQLGLYNKAGTLIHATAYRIPWDAPEWKKEGGWSLEYPDPDRTCVDRELWAYCNDPSGGTPGRSNSIHGTVSDLEPPLCLYMGTAEQEVRSDIQLVTLYFQEPLRMLREPWKEISIDPGGWNPDSLWPADILGEAWNFLFRCNWTEGKEYRIRIPPLHDCSGNRAGADSRVIGTCRSACKGSLVINEIMYDPSEGSPEYVELYHAGLRVTDLKYYAIIIRNEGDSKGSLFSLSDHSRIVVPGQYLVITRCTPMLQEAYGLEESGRWVEVPQMNRLSNNGGWIYLTDRAADVMDAAGFSDEMHMEMIQDTRGVSLERLSAKAGGTVLDNWHSAASIEGHATPGRKNSQVLGEVPVVGWMTVNPGVFSPDNDGYQDLLRISLHPGTTGWVVSLWIADLLGNRVKILANNHLVGPYSEYFWNGTWEAGYQAAEGFYLVRMTGYHQESGNRKRISRSVALIYR